MIIHEIDPDLSGGAIAGIIIGVLAVLGLALVGFLFIIRQRRRRRSHGEPELNGRTEFAISDKPPATTENLKGMDLILFSWREIFVPNWGIGDLNFSDL